MRERQSHILDKSRSFLSSFGLPDEHNQGLLREESPAAPKKESVKTTFTNQVWQYIKDRPKAKRAAGEARMGHKLQG